MGAKDQHEPICRSGGTQIQRAVEGGEYLPGRQVITDNPSDLPPEGPSDPWSCLLQLSGVGPSQRAGSSSDQKRSPI